MARDLTSYVFGRPRPFISALLPRRVFILVALCALALLAAAGIPGPAAAKPLSAQRAAAEARYQQVKAQLESLQATLDRAVEQYNLARIKADKAERSVSRATRQLALARLELAAGRRQLSDRVVAIYKQRTLDFVDVILEAQSFSDMQSNIFTLEHIGNSDARLVTQLDTAVATVKHKRAELVVARGKARRFVAQVEHKKAKIESGIAHQQNVVAGAQAEIKRIRREQARAVAKAKAAAAAAARAAAIAAARVATTTPSTSSGSSTPSQPSNPGVTVSGPIKPAGAGHPEVIAIAKHYLGIPYLYGGSSPSTGFDCSGFVMYCYAQIGISLPHYSGYQQNMGTPVSMNALVPGDLVFRGRPVSYHVGMYAGGGLTIHSPHTGDVVRFAPLAGWEYAVRLP